MNNIINILVGSKNPVKINATINAFKAYFPNAEVNARSIVAPSDVSDQPMSERETLLGAKNRVNFCKSVDHNSGTEGELTYFVAIEGGVNLFEYGPAAFAYVVINNEQQQAIGKSAELPLPMSVYQTLNAGQELGDVIDTLFGTENAKQKTGAMGLFTNDLVTRQSTYEQALILALAKIVHPSLFNNDN